jgi:hypothetical protein
MNNFIISKNFKRQEKKNLNIDIKKEKKFLKIYNYSRILV